MKALYFVLASTQLSLAAPAGAAADNFECACPMPLCPAGQPERCECQNAAIAACWDKQLEEGKTCPAPALKDCRASASGPTSLSSSTQPIVARSSAPGVRELAASPSASCACEPYFCAQFWPDSCRCANSNKLRCHQSCGGVAPRLQDCGDTQQQSASLYAAFALPTAPGPVIFSSLPPVQSTLKSSVVSSSTLHSTLSFEKPSAIPSGPLKPQASCACEPTFCVASFPDSCYCQNRAKFDCYNTCGGVEPEFQNCETDLQAPSISDLEDFPTFTDAPVEIPSDVPTPTSIQNYTPLTPAGIPPDTVVTPQSDCKCAAVFCAQDWPLSCKCSNQAASDCAALCHRPAPQFLDCSESDPESLEADLPNLFDMIPDPADIPVIFTNLIPELSDPIGLPEYLENLPDYIKDLTKDYEPWSETHEWFSFFYPAATSNVGNLFQGVLPTTPAGAVPELSTSQKLIETTATFSQAERAAATPSTSKPADEKYHICGHRAAVPCPTGYDCVKKPGARCGPELDCGGYCVDAVKGHTLLANVPTQSSSTPGKTTNLEALTVTEHFPTNTLRTSTRRGNPLLPPRQLIPILSLQVSLPVQVSLAASVAAASPTRSSVAGSFLQIPCGEGYLACNTGLECVDIFVSGLGFAEKRSYCVAAVDIPDDLTSSASSTSVTPTFPANANTLGWDPAWPGPITTLRPMFGPGPVGLSLLSNFRPPSYITSIATPITAIPSTTQPTTVPVPKTNPIVPPPIGPRRSSTTRPRSTTSATPSQQPIYFRCGGLTGVACPSGLTCVRDLDPAAPRPMGGCGPACGEVGVCIVPKQCGGFAGIQCSEPGRMCADDPNDDCDPENGGADCMGMCV